MGWGGWGQGGAGVQLFSGALSQANKHMGPNLGVQQLSM